MAVSENGSGHSCAWLDRWPRPCSAACDGPVPAAPAEPRHCISVF